MSSSTDKRSGAQLFTQPPGARGSAAATWTPEEQKQLDAALKQFPAERHPVAMERYLRIALSLPGKTARDVALRVKWLAEAGKGRKRKPNVPAYPSASAAAAKGKAPAAAPGGGVPVPAAGMPAPAAMPHPHSMQPAPAMPHPHTLAGAPRATMPAGMVMAYAPAAQPVPLDDHGASSVGGVSGPIAQLLDANYAILNQFKANMQQCRVHENTDLLVRFRDNILTILNQMNSMGGVMAQMPPLPVRMNVELANNFLPKPGMPTFFPPLGMHHPGPHFAPHPGMAMNGWQPGMMAPHGFMPPPAVVPAVQQQQQPGAVAVAAPAASMPSAGVPVAGVASVAAPSSMPAAVQPLGAQPVQPFASAPVAVVGVPLPQGAPQQQPQQPVPAAVGPGPPQMPAAATSAAPVGAASAVQPIQEAAPAAAPADASVVKAE